MDSVISIADAVTARLESFESTGGVIATRAYIPQLRPQEIGGDTRLTVVPTLYDEETLFTRGTRDSKPGHQDDITIDVAVQKKTTGQIDDLDACRELTADVIEHLRGLVTESPKAALVQLTNDPIFVPEHIRDYGVFTSILTLRFRRIA